MTETVIKQFGVYSKSTHEHLYTIIFKMITPDKPYYARCNEKGFILDLRKSQSYVNFDLNTNKLKRVKGYYDISIWNVQRSREDNWIFLNDGYVKTSDNVPLSDCMLLDVAQKIVSSEVVFVSRICGENFSQRRAPTENEVNYASGRYLLCRSYMFITEDLLGEEVPLPDRAVKQVNAREEKKLKRQNRIKLFETFLHPILENEDSLYYSEYRRLFSMPYAYAEKVLKQHLEEVVIPRFKELGVQMSVDDFDLRLLTFHCDISLNKVKLDNIDDV